MRTIFRATCWFTFAAFLVGVGWILYMVLPIKPRWEVHGSSMAYAFVPDGSAVILVEGDDADETHVTVRDLKSGEVRWALPNTPYYLGFFTTPDGKTLLQPLSVRENHDHVWKMGREFLVASLESGQSWTITLPEDVATQFVTFAPEENVAVFSNSETSFVLDLLSGVVLARLEVKRHLGTSFVQFTPSHLVFWSDEADFQVWDRQTRQLLNAKFPPGRLLQLSPRGNFVVLREYSEDADADKVVLWDFPAFTRKSELGLSRHVWMVAFDRREKTLAASLQFWLQSPEENPAAESIWKVDLWDIPSMNRQRVESFRAHSDIRDMDSEWFSPDGRFLFRVGESFEMHDVPSGRSLWRRANPLFTVRQRYEIRFGNSGEFVAAFDEDLKKVQVFHAATGAVHLTWSGEYDDDCSDVPTPYLDGKGRYLVCSCLPKPVAPGKVESLLRHWLPGKWSDSRRLMLWLVDMERGELILNCDLDAVPSLISEDGRFMLAQSRRKSDDGLTTSCWDIPFARPWGWIIGVPGGVAVSVLAWKWLRRKRRAVA